MDDERVEGWAISRAGVSPAELDRDFSALRDRVREVWQSVFPPRRGYVVLSRSVAGPLDGMRVDVSRGDFRAELDLRCDWQVSSHRGVRSLVIRSSSRAHSAALDLVEDSNQRLARCARRVGLALAVVASTLVFWAFIGTQNPVIAGMMLTILVAVVFAACALVVNRIGDVIATRRRNRVRDAIAGDLGLRESFRRFQALGRAIRTQRRELERGCRGAPFRRVA